MTENMSKRFDIAMAASREAVEREYKERVRLQEDAQRQQAAIEALKASEEMAKEERRLLVHAAGIEFVKRAELSGIPLGELVWLKLRPRTLKSASRSGSRTEYASLPCWKVREPVVIFSYGSYGDNPHSEVKRPGLYVFPDGAVFEAEYRLYLSHTQPDSLMWEKMLKQDLDPDEVVNAMTEFLTRNKSNQ